MDREGGFIVLHRRIGSWPLWHSMSAEQRMVWVQILLDANWRDSQAWSGTERFTVKRGQLIHSENTIAKEAGVSRKVVRTAIAKLIAEGAIVRSRIGQVQIDGGHETGPAGGPTPFVITVVNYEKYQDGPSEKGPLAGQTEAQRGPNAGPTGAPSEQGEQEEERATGSLTLTPPPPGERKATKRPTADSLLRPLADALVAAYREERGTDYGFDRAKDAEGVKRLVSFSRNVADHVRRWRLALNAPAGNYSFRVDTIAAFATGRIWNHFPPTESAAAPAKKYAPIPEYR